MSISKSRSNFLETARIILESIGNNEPFKTQLAANDYGETQIQEGTALFQDSISLFNQLITRKDEVMSKSRESQRFLRELNLEFGTIRKRLRAAFYNDPEARASFGLDSPIQSTIAKAIAQNVNFYNAVLTNTDLMAKAQTAGIGDTRFQAGLARAQAFQALRTEYVSLKGSQQELVEALDLSLRKLKSWLTALIHTARRIYIDTPQLLESVGIFTRNQPKKKKKDDNATTDPGTTDPGTTDPGTTDPGTTDPGTTDPGTTDLGTTDPGTTDPGTTDPGTTEPSGT